MIRPARCPFCTDPVDDVRFYELHQPPDERGLPPIMPPEDESPDLPDSTAFTTVDAYQFEPCGHIFQQSDFDAWRSNEIFTRELGDRVVNPKP